jgi:acyl-CoA thioester hydrolase
MSQIIEKTELSTNTEDYHFFMTVRVRYPDVDSQQSVYYGAFFDFFEACRQEYWHRLGIKLGEMREKGYFITIAETSCRYRKSAHYDDVLDVYVRTSRIGKSSFDIDYLVVRRADAATIASARSAFVLVGDDGKPREIPDWFTTAISQFEAKKQ